jgi:peptidoglycan/xylan/chitin deacetylase (PgdA/CDA1 family)
MRRPRPAVLLALSMLLLISATEQLVSGDTPPAMRSALVGDGTPAGRTQFVLLGFDATPGPEPRVEDSGFHYIYESINRHRAPGRPPNSFTLFISTGLLQLQPGRSRHTEAERAFEGGLPRNQPVIGYARNLSTLQARAANVRELSARGVEIGSHAVRHAHGLHFDEATWRAELADHQRISDLLSLPRPLGFRAPFLEYNEAMYTALAAHSTRYDASRPGARTWPTRHASGIWLFSIPTVFLPDGRRALFFDDNLRELLLPLAHASGKTGRDAERHIDDAYYRAGLAEFQERYRGERAPFLISGHGNFRGGILRLMRHVCGMPDVRCATFSEAVRYLDAHPELAGR